MGKGVEKGMGEVSEWNASESCLCCVRSFLTGGGMHCALCVIMRVISGKSGERERVGESPDQPLTRTLMSAARAQRKSN